MAYIDTLYDKYFLEYASYVIKDRAIPGINDGLKPVQRRILYALSEMDDGKYHKVANVVGQTMKFHPHGDQPIYSALVNLANKDLFIDKQGNFGNIYTGDEASAARYIECRLTPLARQVLFNPDITAYEDSYDGRNKEPINFPAKIPVLLAQGTEGIAPGMTTRILPHNLIELLEAQIAYLKEKPFKLFPDFPTGGFVDISEYNDGKGKVLVRGKLDTRDPKRILIKELPYGSTSENLIASIEGAARKNKLKISGISDYTAETCEIEIRLARGIKSKETEDALYAFTDCESSISTNCMVIKNEHPYILPISDILKHNTDHLTQIFKAELKLEERRLHDRLHTKTLEQIFIENRIYRQIEEITNSQKIPIVILNGFKPYKSSIKREVTTEDIDTLLKIPVRRISLYDIHKADADMKDIRAQLKQVRVQLKSLRTFTIAFLEKLIEKYQHTYPRKTKILAFKQVDVREAAQRNLKLKYDKRTGYLGYGVNGNALLDVSPYDRVVVIRKTGAYSIHDVPEKLFVDKGMRFCGFLDKDRVFTILYKDMKTQYPYIKRCQIEKFILNRGYNLVPDGCKILKLTTASNQTILVDYKPKPRLRVLQETFSVENYPIRSNKARGIKLSSKETKSTKFILQET